MALSIVPSKVGSDRFLFSSSEETAIMMKKIQATHCPDQEDQYCHVDVKPLLLIIEDVLYRAAPTIPGIVHEAELDHALEDKPLLSDFNDDMLQHLAFTINKISCAISYKCSSGGDGNATTLALFNMLPNYSWEAKAVIALGAFAVNYGEVWLIAQLYQTNPLAKSVAIIKQLPEIMEHADTLKPKFDALTNLIKAMMDLTKCIIEFGELPSQYINGETPEYATAIAHIPTAVYWIIRSIVACASQIMGLIGMSHEYITCKCSSGGDANAKTLALFNMLSNYSWEAKAVIALGAFAVNYGEFWMLAQIYQTNPLAKSVAIIKQLPEIMEHAGTLKPKFDALTNLIKAMMDLTKCIIEFGELPSQYINGETPEYATAIAHIPTAVYWIIRSIVACASQIMGLNGMSHEYIASTKEEVINFHNHLKNQLDLCYHPIKEYQTLVHLMKIPHIDNMKILKALIYNKDDQLPLYDGSSKRRVNIDILRGKYVLLFISDLDLSPEELFILDQMYQESRNNPTRLESNYEVVWMPVVEGSEPWTEVKQKQFENLQRDMPWYSVHHPSFLEPAVIKYIKEVWKFSKKPLLVVLDPQGRVVNPNALHMMWIWGSMAFPFTCQREETLWKKESWGIISLLADTFQPIKILQWIKEGKYIILYGGEDIEWIRKFTTTANDVAPLANIQLEMLYVEGKINHREKNQKMNDMIKAENLSHIIPNLLIQHFLKIVLKHSKKKAYDTILTMLSFDGSDQGWVVICKGETEMARGKADTILESFTQFNKWEENVQKKGFVQALNDHLHELQTPHHCDRVVLSGATGRIPKRVICA